MKRYLSSKDYQAQKRNFLKQWKAMTEEERKAKIAEAKRMDKKMREASREETESLVHTLKHRELTWVWLYAITDEERKAWIEESKGRTRRSQRQQTIFVHPLKKDEAGETKERTSKFKVGKNIKVGIAIVLAFFAVSQFFSSCSPKTERVQGETVAVQLTGRMAESNRNTYSGNGLFAASEYEVTFLTDEGQTVKFRALGSTIPPPKRYARVIIERTWGGTWYLTGAIDLEKYPQYR